MSQSAEEVRQIADDLYKSHYGKMVSLLLRSFEGVNLEIIEDVIQDAFGSALTAWQKNGIPSNPKGWIFTVSKNFLINEIKKERRIRLVTDYEDPEASPIRSIDSLIIDQQLQLLFACAHPDLSPKVQVVITLKYVANLKVGAIARALGTSIDGIDKILVRARQKIKSEKILLKEPSSSEISERLPIVHKIIYLIFNEGFRPSTGKEILSAELCGEALILSKFLLDIKIGDKSTCALHALMLFNASRFGSRVGPANEILELEEQDRKKWDKSMIALGCEFLKQSMGETVSSYHYEATIAFLHTTARDFKSTDWNQISNLYKKLLQLDSNPFVELNYSIALYYSGEKEKSLETLLDLKRNPFFSQYFFLNATLGKIYFLEGNFPEAMNFLNKALSETNFPAEKNFIRKLLNKIPQ